MPALAEDLLDAATRYSAALNAVCTAFCTDPANITSTRTTHEYHIHTHHKRAIHACTMVLRGACACCASQHTAACTSAHGSREDVPGSPKPHRPSSAHRAPTQSQIMRYGYARRGPLSPPLPPRHMLRQCRSTRNFPLFQGSLLWLYISALAVACPEQTYASWASQLRWFSDSSRISLASH